MAPSPSYVDPRSPFPRAVLTEPPTLAHIVADLDAIETEEAERDACRRTRTRGVPVVVPTLARGAGRAGSAARP